MLLRKKFLDEQLSDGKLTIKQRVPYQHGKIQIGQYGNVKHGACCWQNGQRGVMNCSLQKKLLNHFYQHDSRFYKQYVEAGYPSGDFQAI